jgi:tryptophan-rich sensory protein
MGADRVLSLLASLAIVVVYATASWWLVSAGDDWYQRLERPGWQPPDVVFGVIWPYNFVALITAGVVVAVQGTSTVRLVWLVGLAGSVAAALFWARLFYVGHALGAAATALVVAAAGTGAIVGAAFTTRAWAGAILVPYQVWLLLAASLSIGYARLN